MKSIFLLLIIIISIGCGSNSEDSNIIKDNVSNKKTTPSHHIYLNSYYLDLKYLFESNNKKIKSNNEFLAELEPYVTTNLTTSKEQKIKKQKLREAGFNEYMNDSYIDEVIEKVNNFESNYCETNDIDPKDLCVDELEIIAKYIEEYNNNTLKIIDKDLFNKYISESIDSTSIAYLKLIKFKIYQILNQTNLLIEYSAYLRHEIDKDSKETQERIEKLLKELSDNQNKE